MSLHLFMSGTPLLDAAPPTEAERAWWAEACRPFRRRALLMGLPMGLGVVLMPPLLASPAEFLAGGWMYALPIAAVAGVLSGVLRWRAEATALFQSQLAGRRVRERLLADGQ